VAVREELLGRLFDFPGRLFDFPGRLFDFLDDFGRSAFVKGETVASGGRHVGRIRAWPARHSSFSGSFLVRMRRRKLR
jgi:hypothetical protein